MTGKKSKVEISGSNGRYTSIKINGNEVNNLVNAVDVHIDVEGISTVNLKLVPRELEIEGEEFEVMIWP